MKNSSEKPIIERNVHCPYCGCDDAILVSEKSSTTVSLQFPSEYGLKFLLRLYFYGFFYIFVKGLKLLSITKKRDYTTYGFCPKCGNSYAASPSVTTKAMIEEEKLCRVKENKCITGLCRGISEYTGVPLLWVRIVTVMQCLTVIGAYVYFIWAACIPYAEDIDSGAEYERKYSVSPKGRFIAGICKGFANCTDLPVGWVRFLSALLIPTVIFPIAYSIIGLVNFMKGKYNG